MLSRCRSGHVVVVASLWAALMAGNLASANKDEPLTERKANRLAKETSPYLKLHAHNPVDWFPWGPEALEKARAENKPIFLSIGYSSCFWCHVMERKVFENPEIAAYMNTHFVNIKVDREERPDLDDLYMLSLQVYLQATGAGDGGGWPLSMFLTPEGKPIAGGTYFPPEDLPGRPGFPGVLRRVTEIWKDQEAQVRGSADVLAREVQRLSGPSPLSVAKAPSIELVQNAIDQLIASRDPEHGGFGFNPQAANRPKFPQPSKLLFLAHHADQKEVAEALDFTLEKMARGGLYDHLAGGFHRYSTDRKWLVPHFEKMLYDNSQLAEVYAIEGRRTGREDFQKVAHETLRFVLRDLCDPKGGFYSALDAETNGVEGAYYVWSPEEVQKILLNDAPLFAAAYGVDQPSTFEHGHVLHRVKSDEELAKAFGGSAAEVASRLAAAKERLLDVRRQRPPLLRDDKVIVAWNGQMIRSLAVCGKLLNEPGYIAAAERAAMFILTTMRDGEGSLKRTWCEGQADNAACLEDYAFLIDGVVALHEVTGEEKWLNAARRLMDDQIEQYWDDRQGGFFFTADHHEPLIARMKDGYDSVMPSGNSVSADVLTRLYRVTRDPNYQTRAEKTLAAFGTQIEQSPTGFARMLLGAEEILRQPGNAVADAKPNEAELLAKAPPKPKLDGAQAREEEKLQIFTQPNVVEAAKHKQVKGRVFLSTDKLSPGTTTKVAIVLDIAEGWHVNANPAKPDFVRPAEVELTSAAGFELTDIVYPKGKDLKMEDQDEPVSVYEGQAVILGTLKIPRDAKVTSDELKFLLKYQACDHKQCLAPARMKLDGKIDVGPGAKKINTRIFGEK